MRKIRKSGNYRWLLWARAKWGEIEGPEKIKGPKQLFTFDEVWLVKPQ